MAEPTQPPSPSPCISSMSDDCDGMVFVDTNNNSEIISPHCIRVDNSENFPAVSPEILPSLEYIPGTDSSTISLLNEKNPSSPSSKSKKRKIHNVSRNSNGPILKKISSEFQGFGQSFASSLNCDSINSNQSVEASGSRSQSGIIPETIDNSSDESDNNESRYSSGPILKKISSAFQGFGPSFASSLNCDSINSNQSVEASGSRSQSGIIPETIDNSYENNSFNSINRTLVNNVNQHVIIMEPANCELTNSENSTSKSQSEMFTNDIRFARELGTSIFGILPDLNVKKIFSKKMYVLRFTGEPDRVMDNIIKTVTLGPWDIKCRLPRSQQFSRGVIGPVGLDSSEEELSDYLKQCNSKITNVRRLKKGVKKTPTLSILIEFDSSKLPEYVNLGFQRFSVRTYVPSPWQCYNCQRFGHSASDCKSKPRCLFCANEHKSDNCPLRTPEEDIDLDSLKCANCKGNHAANYGGCERMKTAKVIEKVRANHKLTYRDALTSIQRNHNTNLAVSNINNNLPVGNNLHELNSGKQIPHIENTKKLVNSSTQTDISEKPQDDSMKKLSVLIVRLIGCLGLDGGNSGMSEMLSIVKDVMNVDITRDICDNSKGTGTVKKNKQKTDNISQLSNSSLTYNSHPKNKSVDPSQLSNDSLTYDSHPKNKSVTSPGKKKNRALRSNTGQNKK